MGTFITVPREIFDDGLFVREPYSRREAFLDLVQKAVHEETELPVRGGTITLNRGEVFASIRYLASRWGWSKSKVEAVLKEFISMNLIGHKSDTSNSTLSIVNYDLYQKPVDDCKDESKDTCKDANWDKDNKDKESKELNEKKTFNDVKEKRKRFVPPTVEEVRAYCQESNYPIDAESFVNYYQSKGWMIGKSPMKDWQAAVRTWVSKRKEQQPQLFSQEQPPQEEPEPKRTISISFINSYYKKAWMSDEQWQREFENTIKAHKDAGYEIIYDE